MPDLTPEEARLLELERRFHFDPKFHELVAAMASAVESQRIAIDDVQDAVTLLKAHQGGNLRGPAGWFLGAR